MYHAPDYLVKKNVFASDRIHFVVAAETPPPALQMAGLKQVSLRQLHPSQLWRWSSVLQGDRSAVISATEVAFGSPQHPADRSQGPCAEHGWRCDLSADQQAVLLSR